MSPRVAYLADGTVHLKLGDEPARVVDSPFIGAARRREASIVQRNAWKAGGPTAFVAARAGEDVAGGASFAAIIGMSQGRAPGELLYLVRTSAVTGLFAFDATTGEEKRLFHGNQYQMVSAATRPGIDLVACSLQHDAVASHIGVMRADGSALSELTDGDSIDASPSWVPGGTRRLVYQSAGMARDAAGRVVGVGPSAINELDLERREVRTLAESRAHDLLAPRMSEDGTLHYIRRPWNAHSRIAPLRLLLELLLLPFRLAAAIFNWLNFFTVRYGGRPLVDAGGAQQRQLDARHWFVWSNLAGAAARASGDPAARDVDATVPSTWQLVRQPAGGEPEVVARCVRAFDLTADGLVYSTGNAIRHRTTDGADVCLCTGSRIAQVVALP